MRTGKISIPTIIVMVFLMFVVIPALLLFALLPKSEDYAKSPAKSGAIVIHDPNNSPQWKEMQDILGYNTLRLSGINCRIEIYSPAKSLIASLDVEEGKILLEPNQPDVFYVRRPDPNAVKADK